MNYKKIVLKNGVRLLYIPMPSLASSTLTVWVKVGSRQENEKIAGISHFLEHMVFKGSLKRPSAREISTAVDSIGGEFNAGTSKEWTNFYIKAQSSAINTSFDVLSDMVLNPLIKEEEIEREKGVILEEMAMYEDTPMIHVGDVFESLAFKGNSLGRDTIGYAKVIKSVKRSDFVSYRKTHYFAENIVLTVSGSVDEKEAIHLAETYFGGLRSLSQKPSVKKFSSKQAKPEVYLKSKKNEQAHFILGFLGFPKGHKKRYAESILAAILGGGMSSRLFIEVRERRGLAYSVKTSADHYTDTGSFATYAGVDPKKAGEAIKVILDQYYGISKGNLSISKVELTKAKEYVKGHLALYLEDTRNINTFFGEEELLLDKVETPETVFKAIDKVTVEEVVEVAKDLFVAQKLNLGIIGPYNSEGQFRKLLF